MPTLAAAESGQAGATAESSSGVLADIPGNSHEFYFTRGIYSGEFDDYDEYDDDEFDSYSGIESERRARTAPPTSSALTFSCPAAVTTPLKNSDEHPEPYEKRPTRRGSAKSPSAKFCAPRWCVGPSR